MGNENKNEGSKTPEQKPPFRGAAIHIQQDGKYGMELVGVTIMEVYGALTLVIEKMKKDLRM